MYINPAFIYILGAASIFFLVITIYHVDRAFEAKLQLMFKRNECKNLSHTIKMLEMDLNFYKDALQAFKEALDKKNAAVAVQTIKKVEREDLN
jgi:hypothetical protein